MKKLFFLSVFVCYLLSCKNGKKPAEEDIKAAVPLPIKIIDKVLGSYVGAFGNNKITLLITKAQQDSVTGRSVVGGNDRPFQGIITEKDGLYSIRATEPGDDPNDGIFNFTIKKDEPDIVSGSWTPNDNTKKAKTYTLQRKEFSYRLDVGDYPESSQRLLTEDDMENMMKPELTTMRNEIYARHGYCFSNRAMRDYFEELDWYIPDNTDIRNKLTDIERKNITLIKRYEKYSEEFGDDFGR
jgi:hypothetical protein